jgi:hypothetical protein
MPSARTHKQYEINFKRPFETFSIYESRLCAHSPCSQWELGTRVHRTITEKGILRRVSISIISIFKISSNLVFSKIFQAASDRLDDSGCLHNFFFLLTLDVQKVCFFSIKNIPSGVGPTWWFRMLTFFFLCLRYSKIIYQMKTSNVCLIPYTPRCRDALSKIIAHCRLLFCNILYGIDDTLYLLPSPHSPPHPPHPLPPCLFSRMI